MSFHGGLIGIIFSIYLFSIKNSVKFFYLSDLVSIVAPIGLFLGRMSNFINTELYGRVTDFPFAIIYTDIDNNPRHPSQLYESICEGFLMFFFVVHPLYPSSPKIKRWQYFWFIFYFLDSIYTNPYNQPPDTAGTK